MTYINVLYTLDRPRIVYLDIAYEKLDLLLKAPWYWLSFWLRYEQVFLSLSFSKYTIKGKFSHGRHAVNPHVSMIWACKLCILAWWECHYACIHACKFEHLFMSFLALLGSRNIWRILDELSLAKIKFTAVPVAVRAWRMAACKKNNAPDRRVSALDGINVFGFSGTRTMLY